MLNRKQTVITESEKMPDRRARFVIMYRSGAGKQRQKYQL